MSDEIGHHCGIAMIRIKKPLSYFNDKYGSPLWAFNQLFLLMEKQHNRGQDGAGIGSMKLNMPVGESFMFRERSTSSKALAKIFGSQHKVLGKMIKKGRAFYEFPETIKHNLITVEKSCLAICAMEHLENMVPILVILIFVKATGRVRT